jgi:hypothetical protein
MERRSFLKVAAGTLLILPVGTFLVEGCGDNQSTSGDAPAAPPQKAGTQVVYTTNLVGAHSHTFGIEGAAFSSPPAAGVSGSTSSDEGHMHSVTVAMTDLQNVQNGQTVKITTAASGGHTHVLTLVKVA